MDYCAPMNILNGIYVFEFSEQKLISRLERMLAAGCDVKLNLLKFTDEQFEKYVETYSFHIFSKVNFKFFSSLKIKIEY